MTYKVSEFKDGKQIRSFEVKTDADTVSLVPVSVGMFLNKMKSIISDKGMWK